LLKILAKALKIRVKMAPNVVWLQKWHPRFTQKHMKNFFWRLPKKGVHDLVEENS